jgi:2-dehydropantoate 2-reductase
MSTRIAIVCAGAIGGYVGAYLTRAKEDVVLIDQYPEHVEVMRGEGVHLSGLLSRDNFATPVKALHVHEAQKLSMQAPIDIAFITSKSYDTAWATTLIKPYLSANGFVVSLQNAINEETIASVVGWGRTLGVAIAGLGVELYEPGKVKRTQKEAEGQVVFRAGEVHGRITPRAELVAKLLSAADRSSTTTNLWGERWTKLIVNVMRNGVAAVSGLGGPDQNGNEVSRLAMIKLASEAVRVGQALGYQLGSAQGLDPETLALAGEGDKTALDTITRQLLDTSILRAEDNRPSMAQDVFKGRRTEIDEINGMVVLRGKEVGIPTPANAKIQMLVHKVLRGELKPSVDALREIIA